MLDLMNRGSGAISRCIPLFNLHEATQQLPRRIKRYEGGGRGGLEKLQDPSLGIRLIGRPRRQQLQNADVKKLLEQGSDLFSLGAEVRRSPRRKGCIASRTTAQLFFEPVDQGTSKADFHQRRSNELEILAFLVPLENQWTQEAVLALAEVFQRIVEVDPQLLSNLRNPQQQRFPLIRQVALEPH